jgi:RNA polymerase sigma-70 factor, ECF subfamily
VINPTTNRMWNPNVLDKGMVEKVKNGDITAFEELYALYKMPVYGLCQRLTRNVMDAEDLTQEVFLRVYRQVHTFRGEAAFGSWLYRVTTNVVMMHLRKRHVEKRPLNILELQNQLAQPVSQPGRDYRSDPVKHIALIRALCGLTKNRRTLVFLHDVQGLTHNEVAKSLGVTASTSKSRLYQAHRKLRDALDGADTSAPPPIPPSSTLEQRLGVTQSTLPHELVNTSYGHPRFPLAMDLVQVNNIDTHP